MSMFSGLAGLFTIPADEPVINRARLKAIAKQVPLLYGLIISSTYALSWTYLDRAPILLAIFLPQFLTMFGLFRMVMHFRATSQNLTDEQVHWRLQSSIWLGLVLGVTISVWALVLFLYGDAPSQSQVVFFLVTILSGAVFCLKPLQQAVASLMASVVLPCALFFFFTGSPAFQAIALNLLFVSLTYYVVAVGYGEDFAALIRNKQQMEEQQAETQALSDANYKLANIDSLTGLPNRRSFFARLDSRMVGALEGEADPLAVGILDLDGFKPVNDIYGHAMGDRLLVEVGRRLNDILTDNIFLARLGGDEFGLIVGGDVSDLELGIIGERLRAAMQKPFDMGEFTARMGASIGFAVYPKAAYSAQLLFERADYALYHAKTHATGETVLFSKEHEKRIQEIHGLERHLRDADFNEELSLVFQPIVNTYDGQTRGVEALARWNSPVLGKVPPDVFIAVAEKAGIINNVTQVLLTKALEAAKHWPDSVFLSFNLSAHDIGSPQCVDALLEILEASGFPRGRLCFEITETAVMRDYEHAIAALRKLRSMGIEIALDDFGTGQSSLSSVRSLPLDRVKVDRSFIEEIETDVTARAVVQTVIDLCRNLELQCVVEGVENETQLEALRDMHCFNIQGYLFSQPMTAEDMHRYLTAEHKIGAATA